MGNTLLLTLLIFVAALLYSSVGHAGASGYLAAMALFNLAPGAMKLPIQTYKIILGCVLLFAAWRLAFKQSVHAPTEQKPIPLPPALGLGAAIGFLSGLTGVGGGIFLSPVILLLGWADTRKTAGVSVVFILVNS